MPYGRGIGDAVRHVVGIGGIHIVVNAADDSALCLAVVAYGCLQIIFSTA